MSLDLAPALRAALVDNAAIAGALATWEGDPAVITRRPVPDSVGYPMIITADNIALTDQDLISTPVPVVTRQIGIYGTQPDQYRVVERLGYQVRSLFHRQRGAITVAGFHVIDIIASGPIAGPTDDETTVARIVTLTIRLSPQP